MIREAIANAAKPKFIVMMIGLNDRTQIRERPLQAGPPSAAAAHRHAAVAGSATWRVRCACADPLPRTADAERPGDRPVVEPSSARGGERTAGYRTYEFRTEEWAEHYTKRIDATIAALKSAGVPVFWVGLPSIRGPKSTSDMQYLNDLYRARAEKAGITYIDVWDGFVDESGRFAVQGPDFEGQIRRLRASDGVHFTKAGARKLAHYLEREIRRVMHAAARSRSRCRRASRRLPQPSGAAGRPRPRARSPVRWCR